MKLMIVGSDQVYAIENFYAKYLRELGLDVSVFTAQNYFYEYYNRSIFNKLIFKSSLSGIIPRINKLFRAEAEKFQPDIVWVFKGMEIMPETLKWLRNRNILLTNYNPDNPFIFSGKGSGNRYVTESIGLYDLHFTYNTEVMARLRADYQVETEFLPFGFDLDEGTLEKSRSQQEVIKCCFVGNPDSERAAFIKKLLANGISIDLYGHHWEKYIEHNQASILPPVYGHEFWKAIRRYRIQLNLMRPHNENSHNMRSFEIPGVGGIMLAPDTVEHRMFFTSGEDCFLFSDADDCSLKVGRILEMSDTESARIRETARRNSLLKGYRYSDRAKTVFDTFCELEGNRKPELIGG